MCIFFSLSAFALHGMMEIVVTRISAMLRKVILILLSGNLRWLWNNLTVKVEQHLPKGAKSTLRDGELNTL